MNRLGVLFSVRRKKKKAPIDPAKAPSQKLREKEMRITAVQSINDIFAQDAFKRPTIPAQTKLTKASTS